MNLLKQYFLEFIGHFAHDWKHNRILFFLELFGMVFVLGGFISMSILGNAFPLWLFFLMDGSGAGCMIIAGHIRHSGFIVLFQSIMLIAGMYGFIHLFFMS